jgi:mannitol-1-phosphate 5-dehydrogenase
MSDVTAHPDILNIAREAFLNESGAALIKKYAGLDPLFTTEGFEAYAGDLLERMMNPYLRDQVDRVIRDPHRKLGWNDRLIGTLRLCLSQGIHPKHFAVGTKAALQCLSKQEPLPNSFFPSGIWKDAGSPSEVDTILKVLA